MFQSYKEISGELDLTADMEKRFEDELAALRLRRSFLKQVLFDKHPDFEMMIFFQCCCKYLWGHV